MGKSLSLYLSFPIGKIRIISISVAKHSDRQGKALYRGEALFMTPGAQTRQRRAGRADTRRSRTAGSQPGGPRPLHPSDHEACGAGATSRGPSSLPAPALPRSWRPSIPWPLPGEERASRPHRPSGDWGAPSPHPPPSRPRPLSTHRASLGGGGRCRRSGAGRARGREGGGGLLQPGRAHRRCLPVTGRGFVTRQGQAAAGGGWGGGNSPAGPGLAPPWPIPSQCPGSPAAAQPPLLPAQCPGEARPAPHRL